MSLFTLRVGQAGGLSLAHFSQRGGRNRRRQLAFIVPLSRRENEERERLASHVNRREGTIRINISTLCSLAEPQSVRIFTLLSLAGGISGLITKPPGGFV